MACIESKTDKSPLPRRPSVDSFCSVSLHFKLGSACITNELSGDVYDFLVLVELANEEAQVLDPTSYLSILAEVGWLTSSQMMFVFRWIQECCRTGRLQVPKKATFLLGRRGNSCCRDKSILERAMWTEAAQATNTCRVDASW